MRHYLTERAAGELFVVGVSLVDEGPTREELRSTREGVAALERFDEGRDEEYELAIASDLEARREHDERFGAAFRELLAVEGPHVDAAQVDAVAAMAERLAATEA